jgi:hypothetical protein
LAAVGGYDYLELTKRVEVALARRLFKEIRVHLLVFTEICIGELRNPSSSHLEGEINSCSRLDLYV